MCASSLFERIEDVRYGSQYENQESKIFMKTTFNMRWIKAGVRGASGRVGFFASLTPARRLGALLALGPCRDVPGSFA